MVLAAIISAVLALTMVTGGVLAHEVEPVSASPASGENLAQAPTQVQLTFPEELTESGSTLQVFNEAGAQVDLGNGGVDLDDPEHASLVVKLGDLPQGVYLVKWVITLTDGDASQGEYYFGVGNVTLPQAAAQEPEAADPDGGISPTWIGLGAVVVVIVIIGAIILFMRGRRQGSSS